jgi:hypothetical protein
MRSFVALLSQMMCFGNQLTASEDYVENREAGTVSDFELGLKASCVYFFLLASLVPGDEETRECVFHVVLYHRAFDSLKVVLRCVKHEKKGGGRKTTEGGGGDWGQAAAESTGPSSHR